MITVLTTFHKEGLEQYGQRFLDSFASKVDKRIKMLCYAEQCAPNNPDNQQIVIIDQQEVKPLIDFMYQEGLQSHLINKLQYITHEHPLRIFKMFE